MGNKNIQRLIRMRRTFQAPPVFAYVVISARKPSVSGSRRCTRELAFMLGALRARKKLPNTTAWKLSTYKNEAEGTRTPNLRIDSLDIQNLETPFLSQEPRF